MPRPTAASARRSEYDSAAAVVGSDRTLALNGEMASWKVKAPASFSGGCGISGSSCTTQTHHRRRRDDDDPIKIFRLARDRACWPAGAASGRWAWRGRGARRGSRRVRVVCRAAERRRDKFKRQRRSGVMVCVSVFVTHQEARVDFEWFHDSTKHPASVPRANSRRFDQKPH